MVREGSVTRLLQILRSDDAAERDLAARLIWRRYFRDLLELARNNLNNEFAAARTRRTCSKACTGAFACGSKGASLTWRAAMHSGSSW